MQSLILSSMSHDPSEIILTCWFAAQYIFLIIMAVENRIIIFFNSD